MHEPLGVLLQVSSKEDELASKDQELSRALREAAEINESYISDLTAGQQQLETDVASLTAQQSEKDAHISELEQQLASRQAQEAEMQQAQKRLRGQVSPMCARTVQAVHSHYCNHHHQYCHVVSDSYCVACAVWDHVNIATVCCLQASAESKHVSTQCTSCFDCVH